MKFILGLDPGIASIGWALILEAENDNEKSRIIDSNVVKVDFDNFAYKNLNFNLFCNDNACFRIFAWSATLSTSLS